MEHCQENARKHDLGRKESFSTSSIEFGFWLYIGQLLQLMQEIIGAYDRNDKDTLKFLLTEFEKIKKDFYDACQG